MARGGKRQGQPGQAYSNRADLRQPVRVITGQAYGQRVALENAQKAIPLPNNANVPGPAAPSQPPTAAGPAPPALAGQQDFTRPSERPTEPVTTGLPSGPGMGPEVLQAPTTQNDQIGLQLRQLYAMNPNNDILRLIELHDNGY